MRSHRGYTIIEVLIAVIILAIVLPGLTAFVVGSRKALTTSSRLEQGTAVAQTVLDSLAFLPHGVVGSSGSVTRTLGGTNYTVFWGTSPMTVSGNAAGSLVTLTAQWTVGKQVRQSVLKGVLK